MSELLLEWAGRAHLWQVLLGALALNLVLVALCVGLWRLLVGRFGDRSLTGRDLALTLSTVAVNAMMIVPAYLAWRRGWVDLDATHPLAVIGEVVLLVLTTDIVMYFVHRVFHAGVLYRWFHQVHHTDDRHLTAVSLFVMHPLEAAGFGLLLTTMVVAYPLSLAALGSFLTINAVIGTAAHLPPDEIRFGRGGLIGRYARFHHAHHVEESTDYGFFTRLPDRIFGTLNPALGEPTIRLRRNEP